MSVKEIRQLTGLSQQKFGDLYHIPLRTIQNWESGTNEIPEYTLKLLERTVREDYPAKKQFFRRYLLSFYRHYHTKKVRYLI